MASLKLMKRTTLYTILVILFLLWQWGISRTGF